MIHASAYQLVGVAAGVSGAPPPLACGAMRSQPCGWRGRRPRCGGLSPGRIGEVNERLSRACIFGLVVLRMPPSSKDTHPSPDHGYAFRTLPSVLFGSHHFLLNANKLMSTGLARA